MKERFFHQCVVMIPDFDLTSDIFYTVQEDGLIEKIYRLHLSEDETISFQFQRFHDAKSEWQTLLDPIEPLLVYSLQSTGRRLFFSLPTHKYLMMLNVLSGSVAFNPRAAQKLIIQNRNLVVTPAINEKTQIREFLQAIPIQVSQWIDVKSEELAALYQKNETLQYPALFELQVSAPPSYWQSQDELISTIVKEIQKRLDYPFPTALRGNQKPISLLTKGLFEHEILKKKFLAEYYGINIQTLDRISDHLSQYWPLSADFTVLENTFIIQNLLDNQFCDQDFSLIKSLFMSPLDQHTRKITNAIKEYQSAVQPVSWLALLKNEEGDSDFAAFMKIAVGVLFAAYRLLDQDLTALKVDLPDTQILNRVSLVRKQMIQLNKNQKVDGLIPEVIQFIRDPLLQDILDPVPCMKLLFEVVLSPKALFLDAVEKSSPSHHLQNQPQWDFREMMRLIIKNLRIRPNILNQNEKLYQTYLLILEKVFFENHEEFACQLSLYIKNLQSIENPALKRKIIELINQKKLDFDCIQSLIDWEESREYGLRQDREWPILISILNQLTRKENHFQFHDLKREKILNFLKAQLNLLSPELLQSRYRKMLLDLVYTARLTAQERKFFHFCWMITYPQILQYDQNGDLETYDEYPQMIIQNHQEYFQRFCRYHKIRESLDDDVALKYLQKMIQNWRCIPFQNPTVVFHSFFEKSQLWSQLDRETLFHQWALSPDSQKDQSSDLKQILEEKFFKESFQIIESSPFTLWERVPQQEHRAILLFLKEILEKNHIPIARLENQFFLDKIIEIFNAIELLDEDRSLLDDRRLHSIFNPFIANLEDLAFLMINGFEKNSFILFREMIVTNIFELMICRQLPLAQHIVQKILFVLNDPEVAQYLRSSHLNQLYSLIQEIVEYRFKNDHTPLPSLPVICKLFSLAHSGLSESAVIFCLLVLLSDLSEEKNYTDLRKSYEALGTELAIQLYEEMGFIYPKFRVVLATLFEESHVELFFHREALKKIGDDALFEYQRIHQNYFQTHLIRVGSSYYESQASYVSLISRLIDPHSDLKKIDIVIFAKELARNYASVVFPSSVSGKISLSIDTHVQKIMSLFSMCKHDQRPDVSDLAFSTIFSQMFPHHPEPVLAVLTQIVQQQTEIQKVLRNTLAQDLIQLQKDSTKRLDVLPVSKDSFIQKIDRHLISPFKKLRKYLKEKSQWDSIELLPLLKNICHRLLKKRAEFLPNRDLPEKIFFHQFIITQQAEFRDRENEALYHRTSQKVYRIYRSLTQKKNPEGHLLFSSMRRVDPQMVHEKSQKI